MRLELGSFAQNNYNGQLKEDDMGRACSMGVKRNAYRLMVGKPEDQYTVGWIILKWIFER
jgi:hypothetical protein